MRNLTRATRHRTGLSLTEVLVASLILTAILFPVLLMFHSSATVAADDVREMHAYRLAEEVIEHIAAVHELKRTMGPIPQTNESFIDAGLEMDLEELLGRYPGEEGAPLYCGGTSMMGSRLHLHPTEPGFHRYLSIDYQAKGRERTFLSQPTLLGLTVRVHYTIPRTIDVIHRDIELSTLLFADPMPPRSADDDQHGEVMP